jgi:hypothetical protein
MEYVESNCYVDWELQEHYTVLLVYSMKHADIGSANTR